MRPIMPGMACIINNAQEWLGERQTQAFCFMSLKGKILQVSSRLRWNGHDEMHIE
jgi:hypothetical protein